MRRSPLVHPLLFAAFPVLFLWASNLDDEIPVGTVIPPLAVSLAGAGAVFALLRLLLRNSDAAAFLTTLLLVLFFSFGHVENAIDPLGFQTRESVLLVEWGLIALAAVLTTLRFRRRLRAITPGLNALGAVLVLLNLVPIVLAGPGGETSRAGDALPRGMHIVGEPRDVYYVIFDRYANEDVLAERFGFDNSEMLSWLESQGFYVARDSVANYPKTAHSLASSLNMTYLTDLARSAGADSHDWEPILVMLSDFKVARYFRALGYRYYHIGSWWTPTREDSSADVNFTFGAPSEFSSALLATTAWEPISEGLGIGPFLGFDEAQYERVQYQFEKLEQIPEIDGPTFTFVHFTLPHAPYVFDGDGDYMPPAVVRQRTLTESYLEQLRYTNSRMKEMVSALLAGPDQSDPIVILQSDEGPHPVALEYDEAGYKWTEASDEDLELKLSILNAYYFPGVSLGALYPGITPANTFRLVFDLYFAADLPLLEDRVWVFEDSAHPYRLTEVTERFSAAAAG